MCCQQYGVISGFVGYVWVFDFVFKFLKKIITVLDSNIYIISLVEVIMIFIQIWNK